MGLMWIDNASNPDNSQFKQKIFQKYRIPSILKMYTKLCDADESNKNLNILIQYYSCILCRDYVQRTVRYGDDCQTDILVVAFWILEWRVVVSFSPLSLTQKHPWPVFESGTSVNVGNDHYNTRDKQCDQQSDKKYKLFL